MFRCEREGREMIDFWNVTLHLQLLILNRQEYLIGVIVGGQNSEEQF